MLSDLNPESNVICGMLADGERTPSAAPVSMQPAPVAVEEGEDNDEYPSLF